MASPNPHNTNHANHANHANGNDRLFSLAPAGFAWATGIEDTFIGQTERIGERVLDEYALTHHYLYWREDIDRAADLGVRAMRYGIPWYKVEPAPGRFDWSWTDRVLEYAAHKGIAVIADLMHYGTPLWMHNQFLNSAYPQRVAAYESEFASRYRHLLSHYTPLNEPMITVDFCGELGIWPPYLRGNDGSVKVLRSVARGIVLSVEAIREADPNAVIVNVDAAGEYVPLEPGTERAAALRNARTFIATDLVTGLVGGDHPLRDWLLTNGMDEEDLAWHRDHAVQLDIIGVNYYPETSVQGMKLYKGEIARGRLWGGHEGLERSLHSFWSRYGKPLMVTETSTNGPLDLRSRWLSESIAAIGKVRSEGIPLVGYTWWPLFDLIDWSYRASARPIEDFMARLGPPMLDVEQIAGMLSGMRWTSLEQLPLEAFLAPMGLYTLEMQFEGTFARLHTSLVDQYRDAMRRGPETVGEVRQGADSGAVSHGM